MKKYIIILLLLIPAFYSAKAHVTLLNPAGGETFSAGQELTISWQLVIPHNTLNWDIFFSSDGGLTWDILQADIPASSLSYQVNMPNINSNQARIRIVQDNVDIDYRDDSDNFTIAGATNIRPDIEPLRWNVFPNPFNDFTTLSIDNPQLKKYSFLLVNTLGHTVKKIDGISTDKLIIEKGNLPEGLYFFQLSDGSENLAFGQLLVN